MHPLGDDVADLLEQHGPPEAHRNVPDILFTQTA